MSEQPTGKLTEQINFGVTPETFEAAQRVESQYGIRITQIARAGFITELQRYRHGLHAVPDADTLRLLGEAQALGINVRAELTAILQRATGPSAA